MNQYAVLYASLTVHALGLHVWSASEQLANSDEVSATSLSPGTSHSFVLPLPTGVARDVFQNSHQALVRVTSSNPEVASASVAAVLDRRRLLLKTGPTAGLLQCKVTSVCRAPGHSRLRLDFAPLSQRLGMAPMFLAKTCTSDVLHGFNVGQEPLGMDVVKDGEPQWTRQNEMELAFNQKEVNLYVTMASSSSTSQQFAFPVVRTTAVDWGLPGEMLRTAGKAKSADAGAGSIVQVEMMSDLDKGLVSRDSPKTLRLAFKCFKAGTARIELVLSPKLAWEPYRPLSLWLTKRCGGGFKKGFQVGSQAGGKDLVVDGIVKGHPNDVDGLTDQSSFYIKYAPTGPQDPDQEPKPVLDCVESSNGKHAAALKMNVDIEEAAVAADGGRRYNVLYSCFDRSDFECTLRIGLELWRSPQLKWKKSCGGTARPDMVVESSLARYATVFSSGQPAPAWLLKSPQVTLLPEETDVSFTVHRRADSQGSKPMVLFSPQAQSSDTSVLETSIANAESVAGRVLGSGEDGATLLVQHTCKGYGHALVTVVLPTGDGATGSPDASTDDLNMFGPVSFSYYKSCSGSGFFLQSAGVGIMGILCISSVAVAGCAALRPAEASKEIEDERLGRAYL